MLTASTPIHRPTTFCCRTYGFTDILAAASRDRSAPDPSHANDATSPTTEKQAGISTTTTERQVRRERHGTSSIRSWNSADATRTIPTRVTRFPAIAKAPAAMETAWALLPEPASMPTSITPSFDTTLRTGSTSVISILDHALCRLRTPKPTETAAAPSNGGQTRI